VLKSDKIIPEDGEKWNKRVLEAVVPNRTPKQCLSPEEHSA